MSRQLRGPHPDPNHFPLGRNPTPVPGGRMSAPGKRFGFGGGAFLRIPRPPLPRSPLLRRSHTRQRHTPDTASGGSPLTPSRDPPPPGGPVRDPGGPPGRPALLLHRRHAPELQDRPRQWPHHHAEGPDRRHLTRTAVSSSDDHLPSAAVEVSHATSPYRRWPRSGHSVFLLRLSFKILPQNNIGTMYHYSLFNLEAVSTHHSTLCAPRGT